NTRGRIPVTSMKNISIVMLVIAVGILSLFARSQRIDLEQQRRQVQELTAKLDSAPKTASLDLQEQCWRRAQAFALPRHNHYNATLGRCFVLQYNFGADALMGRKATYKALHDAFQDDQSYGDFYGIRD